MMGTEFYSLQILLRSEIAKMTPVRAAFCMALAASIENEENQ